MVDKKGKGFVAMGDDGQFDRPPSFEVKAEQFPVKMAIWFSMSADIQSLHISDYSAQIKLCRALIKKRSLR